MVPGTPGLRLEPYASGFDEPVYVTAPPGDVHRLFVVQQNGHIRVLTDRISADADFLDLSASITSGGERGLLGLAFHPDYASNGRFYVDYTDLAGDTKVSEFRVSDDPNVADPESERVILAVDQPFANHNGGHLAFGADGMLYVALGDGGGGGDPFGNAQRLDTLLGKILRLDVDGGAPYAVPRDNPFVGREGARGEIFVHGLRNPWRFSFDRATGDLYIGDVGQGDREEIDATAAASAAGSNYGWNVMEGNACYPPGAECDDAGLTRPVFDYGHDQGCAVTGGYVYRGRRMPGLAGTYLFGDYCSGKAWTFRLEGGAAADLRERTAELGTAGASLSSFGEDACGEVYFVSYGSGQVLRLAPAS